MATAIRVFDDLRLGLGLIALPDEKGVRLCSKTLIALRQVGVKICHGSPEERVEHTRAEFGFRDRWKTFGAAGRTRCRVGRVVLEIGPVERHQRVYVTRLKRQPHQAAIRFDLAVCDRIGATKTPRSGAMQVDEGIPEDAATFWYLRTMAVEAGLQRLNEKRFSVSHCGSLCQPYRVDS